MFVVSRFDSLAQQVEHNTFNVGVLGSSPKRITRKKTGATDKIKLSVAFFFYSYSQTIKI